MRPDRGDFGGERAADRTAGEIGAVEPRLQHQLMRGEHPVEVRIEHGMAALATGKAGQGRHDDGALLGQRVEERDPARQAAEAGEKSERRAAALLPDPAGKAVDVDG